MLLTTPAIESMITLGPVDWSIKQSVGGFFRTLLSRLSSPTEGQGRRSPDRGDRLVVKSKIHKAHVTGAEPDRTDGVVIDEDLLHYANIAPYEKVLIVDNTNGARVETSVRGGQAGKGGVTVTGGVSDHIHVGDEIIVMSFTWSRPARGQFKSILLDEKNRFVRYLVEAAGQKV